MINLYTDVNNRVGTYRSKNGNGCNFWLDHAVWEVRHSDEAVENANIVKLTRALNGMDIFLAIDQVAADGKAVSRRGLALARFRRFPEQQFGLQRWYCDLISSAGDQKAAEFHLLTLVRDAFSRAAFRDPLARENPHKFRLALEHTQRALDAGELVDRETGVVIRKAVGGIKMIEHFAVAKADRSKLIRTLTTLRNRYDLAKGEPFAGGPPEVMKLDDSDGFLEIRDPLLARRVGRATTRSAPCRERHRGRCRPRSRRLAFDLTPRL